MNHRYTFKVVLLKEKSRPRKDGKYPLLFQVFLNGKRDRISMSQTIKVEQWDEQRQRVKGKSKLANQINHIICKWESKTQDIFYDAIINDKPLTKKRFRELLLNEAYRKDFLTFMKKEIEASTFAKGTIRAYWQAYNHLVNYRKEIPFNDINYDLIDGFENHLVKAKLDSNTRHKHHKQLKKFINVAIHKDVDIKNPYQYFEMPKAKTQRTFLSQEELQLLVELYDSGALEENMLKVCRQFLFMCATGLRISDIKQLTSDHVVGDKLVFRSKKTQRYKMKMDKPLSEFAKKFLPIHKGKLFDTYSYDQTFNKYLKILIKKAGIDKPITAHVGRHTFATTFLELGGKIEVLKDLLDHSNLETTMIYVHITDKRKKEQIKLFDSFMDK